VAHLFMKSVATESFAVAPTSGSAFREAMSHVAGAVHIIATNGPSGLAGATATAVTSVSDNPPSLLVCLNQNSSTLAAINANGRFSINILAAGQKPLAERFSGQTGVQGAARFVTADGWQDMDAVPTLAGALAVFTCRLSAVTPVGSHMVVIGAVEQVAVHAGDAALLYHRRSYKVL
jgi:flavin reductase (DIM6/NTAB) family NADH-FMN oxidoreductase RutF